MTPEETIDFIRLSAVWKHGRAFPIQDCIFYNFGYDKELPYTKIDLDLEDSFPITINSHGIEAPNGCSFVLIANKYTERVDEVMRKIDDIAEQVDFVPIAAFLFSKDQNLKIEIDSKLRFEIHSYIHR